MLPDLTLIIGGAASGKSAFAESLVVGAGLRKIYLATAQSFDGEMDTKIARHREVRGAGWHTIEEPMHLGPALSDAAPDDIVLLDCATLWLSNHLLEGADIAAVQNDLLLSLNTCKAPVVIVTNDVGSGVVPDNKMARNFRQYQGELNQALAAQSDLVVTVIAGLPLVLKGTLPV